MTDNLPATPQMVDSHGRKAPWVPIYCSIVIMIGMCATIYSFANMPYNWIGLLAFAIAAAIAEMTGVELYVNSRSQVSVATIVAMAAIPVLGPVAGAFTHLAGGLTNALTSLYKQRRLIGTRQRASPLQLSLFNTSMWVAAALLAGEMYVWAGGIPGYPLKWNNLIPFILAVAISNFTNLGLLIVIIHLQTGRTLSHIWKQDFQWGVPIAFVGALLGGGGLSLGYSVLGVGGLTIFMLPVLATSYAFRLYVNNTRQYVEDLEKVNSMLEQSNLGLLQSLGAVIDAFDIYTYGHSTQVAAYAREIAAEMGLPKATQEKILRGGLIHDIGKIGVKDAIIGKEGRLTDEEYEALKRHTTIGADIVGQMEGIQDLVPLVRSHHERWDGFGYPDRLVGTKIPLEARILAIADSVDAMLSDRSYRSPRSLADVLKEVDRCSGAQFDPIVVEAFLKVVEKRGESFFTNSAKRVDMSLAKNGIIKPAQELHYLKKSMLPADVLYSASELRISR